ncbi:MAG TPA: integrase core domain-containing protein [Pengzhenrongella sp.]
MGIDDHSRFVVSARVVARATAGSVCAALELAIERFGAPHRILTDNGKVFTARFGPGPGPVRFDRICAGHDIGHLLTAPRSPTTTGKVERRHKILRKEFLTGRVFASVEDAQAQLDAWVHESNHERPHQSIGRVPPFERFRLAPPRQAVAVVAAPAARVHETGPTRVVSRAGTVRFAGIRYPVGAWLAGQRVQVTRDGGLVQISHAEVLVATLARRHDLARQAPAARRATGLRRARPTPAAAAVTRKVDSSGSVSFAGVAYRVGAAWARRQVQVAVVGRTVEISAGIVKRCTRG